MPFCGRQTQDNDSGLGIHIHVPVTQSTAWAKKNGPI